MVLIISGGFAAGGPTDQGDHVLLTNQAETDPFSKVVVSELDRGELRTPHDDQ